MKHIKTFESYVLFESTPKSATGEEIAKNKTLFNQVAKILLPGIKAKPDTDDITIKDVEEFLQGDIQDNPEFDYLEDLGFSVDGFFEWYDN
jgi:hypothetical protein